MNDDKLPNYYDVRIKGSKRTPRPGYVDDYPYTLSVEAVEAPDPETAVRLALRKHWHEDADWFPSESGEGWVVYSPNDGDNDPWLEIDVEEMSDCATAVPYERRLRLAGIRPLEFGGGK